MARRPPIEVPDVEDDDDEPQHVQHRFDPRPLDDGSPGRIIATMVGIVGILLLGSLFWSALGALIGALGAATQAVPLVSQPAVVLTLVPPATALPGPTPVATVSNLPTRTVPTVTPMPTVEPTSAATAVPTADAAGGRAPWVLLPQPAPGTRVSPGAVTIEARGRGDAAITEIRLDLDGVALPVSLEQRSDSIWRGAATAKVGAGQHTVRAVVVDERGRSGAYRWSFEAGQ